MIHTLFFFAICLWSRVACAISLATELSGALWHPKGGYPLRQNAVCAEHQQPANGLVHEITLARRDLSGALPGAGGSSNDAAEPGAASSSEVLNQLAASQSLPSSTGRLIVFNMLLTNPNCRADALLAWL